MLTSEEAREWLAHALENDELAHYGVPGMKWGIRKEEVSGAPKGKSEGNKPKPATKRVKVSKTEDTELSVGESVVLGSLGIGAVGFAYPEEIKKVLGRVGAEIELPKLAKDLDDISKYTAGIDKGKKFLEEVVDTTLPANASLHRIASTAETAIDKPKFATYLADDVLHYRENWSNLNAKMFAKQYITKMTALKDIKIASPDSTVKALEEALDQMLDNKETLRQMYNRIDKLNIESFKNFGLSNIDDAKFVAKRIVELNKDNIWADDLSKASAGILRKAGYSAITDTWDTGLIAKHAVIAIDNDAFQITSIKLKSSHRIAATLASANIKKNAGTYVPSAVNRKITSAIAAVSKSKITQRVVKTAITKKL